MSEEAGGQLVAIGSSAGGIEALSTVAATLPADFPAPIVIAQHLDPRRPSRLVEILAHRTSLKVCSVEHDARLETGTIYVAAENRNFAIEGDTLVLREGGPAYPKPSIDLLLTSAAASYGERLIAVILTGTGSDGAAGARAVHDAGGTVVIQDPSSASFPELPQSLAPTTVDVVARLEAISSLLHDLLTGNYAAARPSEDRALRALLDNVSERIGIDFSSYKMATIQRRLQRRLAATNSPDLEAYTRYLQQHPDEYQRLASSFLIKVTGFFRDPELYEYLRQRVLPDIIAAAREHGRELRLWSAGCATGEESYSLAMLVAEALGDHTGDVSMRIFATDIDADAITFARRGLYPPAALTDLPPGMAERYFTETDNGYEVKKVIRGLTVFSQHDLGQRAPFPRIDLVLCRNVLIYFTNDLQRRALQLFAFSLREGGYLVLGKSESSSLLPEYFALEHPRLKVYRRQGERALIPAGRIRDTARGPIIPQRLAAPRPTTLIKPLARISPLSDRGRVPRERFDSLVVRLPVGVVQVDRRYDIHAINHAARRVLGIHGGAIGEDFIHLTRSVPTAPLRSAIDAAFSHSGNHQAQLEATLAGGETVHLRFTCYPETTVDDNGREQTDSVVVLIQDVTDETRHIRSLQERVQELEFQNERLERRLAELAKTNQELLLANEELSTANAELRSTNEEQLIANEEVQAATEEVQTLNEELQATNEEFETLNEELQSTVEELNTTNDDLESRGIELQALASSLEEQRRASEYERARVEAILASLPDQVVVVDRNGQPVRTNAAYDRLFGSEGLRLEDTEGRPLADEATPQQRAARGEVFTMRFSTRHRDGMQRVFEASGRPIRGPEEGIGGVVVIRDVTTR